MHERALLAEGEPIVVTETTAPDGVRTGQLNVVKACKVVVTSEATMAGSRKDALLEKIQKRQAKVGIIGLGYVGLPLARSFSVKGFPVLGFDVDPAKVLKLLGGQSYIGHIPSCVIDEMRGQGFEATDQFHRLAEVDAVLICVPTPLTETREPDLQFVIRSADAIAASLRPGQLVILESTTYPGTTRDVVRPILERDGLSATKDFFLAFSPEREGPGQCDVFSSNDSQGRRWT